MNPNATSPDVATERPTDRPLLEVDDVTVAFGGLVAVRSVRLQLGVGERLALLGPNGAGKTTLFNAIAGDVAPTSGRVVIKGVDCSRLPSRVRPGLGVARTYQRTRLFADLSVADNLYLAQAGRRGRHRALRRRAVDGEMIDRAAEVAAKVWLGDHLSTMAGALSHGQQRQLEVGMAIVTEPDLMMLDEPASGLSRGERERLLELLTALPGHVGLLLIEHDMDVALSAAERVVVLADGELVATGSPTEIRSSEIVQSIYLGHGAGQEVSR